MASPSAWAASAPLSARRDPGPNVTGPEKWASIVGGGLLAAYGLKRGGVAGLATALLGGALVGRGITGHSPLKRNLIPSETELQLAREHGWTFAAPLSRAVTIGKPPREVYDYFRDFSHLPQFMENVERIEVIDDRRSHWVVKAPRGADVEWDSTITEDVPGERIAWESEPGADIRNTGSVEFREAPGDRGTEVHATILFEPPGGKLGRAVAALFLKDPAIQLRQDLRRFAMIMETGEVATSKAPAASPRA